MVASTSRRVGFSKLFSISRKTNRDIETPSRAARALSLRCSAVGTFLTWIVLAMHRA